MDSSDQQDEVHATRYEMLGNVHKWAITPTTDGEEKEGFLILSELQKVHN